MFYEEPDPDRWVPLDRYPRRLIRHLAGRTRRPGGQMRVFLNLKAGLDRIGMPYRLNNYRYIRDNSEDLVCLLGKPYVLKRFLPHTPIMFGPAIYNHPIDDETLPNRHLIRRVLVPSVWVKKMFAKVWPDIVSVWPVGIDTDRWMPSPSRSKDVDVVIYDKIFRGREDYQRTLLDPLMSELRRRALVVERLRYGAYAESDLLTLARRARSMIYLSRYETQGIAVEQMMAAGVPVLAWDPGGEWQSLEYLLRGVRFGPVTSVPYWNDRCGVKFTNWEGFVPAFELFWKGVINDAFEPRSMIIENKLTLEGAAEAYAALADKYRY